MRHCPECNSERVGRLCWKCGTLTTAAAVGWRYPALPDVNQIRALAKEVGYAIGEHGSKERDLDLMAMPWTTDAVTASLLIQHICLGLNARELEREAKPLGRVAVTIQIDGYFKPTDLSIAPIIPRD